MPIKRVAQLTADLAQASLRRRTPCKMSWTAKSQLDLTRTSEKPIKTGAAGGNPQQRIEAMVKSMMRR
jgi:hypothetical protein